MNNFDQSPSKKMAVIVPTFNRACYLSNAISYVIGQTYDNWTLIIVDDGSSDNTSQVVEPFLSDKRIKYIYQKNKGLAAARNTGIRMSSSEYLAFLDDDDIWFSDRLEKAVRWLDVNPKHAWVYSQVIMNSVNENKKWVYPKPVPEPTLENLFMENTPQVLSVTVRREFLKITGLFDERIKMCEDYDLWLRLANIAPYGVIQKTLGEYVLHSQSMTNDQARMFVGALSVIRNSVKLMNEKLPWLKIRWRISNLYYLIAKNNFKGKNYYAGILFFVKFVITYPLLGRSLSKIINRLKEIYDQELLKVFRGRKCADS